jgi:hypothetical protein
MSLGFSKHFIHFDQFVKHIDPTIEQAAKDNIIMFAAAGNGGGFEGVGYPASSHRVIPIFSTDGFKAVRSEFSPLALRDGACFSALGEDIKSSWPRHLDTTHTKVKSGTSFATPIIAGFAATLLEYAGQGLIKPGRELTHLRSREGMEAVLKLMAANRTNPETGYYDLQPWEFFQKPRVYTEATIIEALKASQFRS